MAMKPTAPELQALHGLSYGDISISRVISGEFASRDEKQRQFLQTLGLPPGIQEEFLRSIAAFPLRLWVIDNSGSMQTTDGHRIVRGAGGREGMVTCSRWEELGEAILWHAELAVGLGAPTEFRLLNHPGGGTNNILQVGVGDPKQEIEAMRRLVATSPIGRTPLCEQIRSVIARVKQEEPTLRKLNQRCVVVIASDGAATDGDISKAMQPLHDLPVWTVVRLCTDDDKVVQYWNGVDEELELDMDVLDDLTGEAAEVCGGNPWLTYGAPLHRLREWGTQNKIFDLLDEKSLSMPEMRNMIGLIFGESAIRDLPQPELQWENFLPRLVKLLEVQPMVYDPIRQRHCPWVCPRKLNKKYKKQGSCPETCFAGVCTIS